jgi:hypothetical protein
MPFPLVSVLISAAISAGLTLLGGLLAPKPKPARPDEVQVPTATEDRIKPYFVGTVRHKSPNCIWYGDFSTKKIRQGGISWLAGNPVVGYKYFIGIQLALGWGPVDALRRVEIGGKEAWTGTVASGNFTIDKPELISSDTIKNGFQATGVFYPGNGSQSADSYVDSKVTGSIPAYKNDALLVFKGLSSGGAYIGNAATFPEINVDLSRYPNTLGVTGSKHIIDTYDANPVCALYEFMTRADNEFGGGFIESQFNLTNWRAVAEAIYAEGIGCSRIITNDQDVKTVIEDYLKLIDGVINVNMETGLFEIVLARYDYDPDTIPHFTDDDFLEVSFTRGAWSETTNEVKLSYVDRTQDYADRVAAAQDSASAAGNLEVYPQTVEIEGISNPTVANAKVWQELKAVSIPLGRLTGKMNREGFELAGASVFKWSSVKYEVDAMIFRVAEASDGGLGEDAIEIKCAQDVYALGATAFDAPGDSDWEEPTTDAEPVVIQEIYEQPYHFHLSDNHRIFTVAAPADGVQQSYDLHTKLSTETTYIERATTQGFTPLGTLESNYNSDVFVTDGSLVVTPVDGMGDLPAAVTPDEIAAGQGLILINNEILAYESYSIDIDGNYVFDNVWGGLLDTLPASHTAGDNVWFISESIGLDPTNYAAGVTVNAKLLSNAPGGQVAIGDATAVTL